jgi:hypothetical protein
MGDDGEDHPRITDTMRAHILDGTPNGSGGHRAGQNFPGKTEFPANWTDDQIIDAVSQTLRNSYFVEDKPVHTTRYGVVNGVRIGVRLNIRGMIVTAFPLDGEGVMRNDSTGVGKSSLPLGSVPHVPLPP